MKSKDNYSETFEPSDLGQISHYKTASPYPDKEVGINWQNYPYPFFHKHDYWEMLIVTSGKLIHTLNGDTFTMYSGQSILIRPDDVHNIVFPENSECQYINILITPAYINKIFDLYSVDIGKIERESSRDLLSLDLSNTDLTYMENSILSFKAFKISDDVKIFNTKLLLNKVMNSLLEKQKTTNSNSPDWMQNLLMFLHNPYSDISDVNSLAAKTPYSYSRLAHIFKAYTGRTILDFSNHIKIEHAKGLLKNTDMSILEISMKLNYYDQSYFSRLFRKRVGMSPMEYRSAFK